MPSPEAEARDRREREDHRRPEDDRAPRPGKLLPTPSDDRLQPSQGSAVREPGANPGRSRRCEGSCSPAETPLAHRETGSREGGGRGSPESEDLPPPPYRTPRGRRIRGTTFDRSRDRCRSRSHARSYGSRRVRHGARRRKDPVDLRIGARQGGRPERARGARRGEHARRVLRPGDAGVVRAVREPDRPLPGCGCHRLGVQGQRCLAARRSRPGDAEGRRRGAVVLRHVRETPAGRRRCHSRPRTANCYTRDVLRRCGQGVRRCRRAGSRRRPSVQGRCERAASASAGTSGSCARTPSAPSGRTP